MPTAHAFTVRDEPPRPEPPRYISSDPADRLPAQAREKFRQLQDQRAEAHVILLQASDKLREFRDQRDQWKGRLDALRSPSRPGVGFGRGEVAGDGHAAVVQCEGEIRRAEEACERQVELVARHTARWEAAARTCDVIERYLEDAGATTLEQFTGELSLKPSKASIIDQIEAKRRRIRELRADEHQARSAPIPSSQAKEIARRQVERLAEQSAPDCLSLVEVGESVRWPTRRVQAQALDARGFVGFVDIMVPDCAGLLAWLDPEKLYERIAAEIDSLSDDGAALSDEQRAAKLVQIRADQLMVEREEESLLERAARDGMVLARRADADPRAILNLADSAPAPRGD